MTGGLVWMAAAAVVVLLLLGWWELVWRPRAVAGKLRAQGVGGPGYRFYHGNLGDMKRLSAEVAGVDLRVGDHDFIRRVQPHFCRWIPLYGRTFLYWLGTEPTLCVADVKMVKQVLFDRTGLFPKSVRNPAIARLLGKGMFLLNGDDWKRHYMVVHPAFDMDNLKTMTATMAGCAASMMAEWEAKMEKGGGGGRAEIELGNAFQELTADVISHTGFGMSSWEGKQVFLAQRELQFLAFSTMMNVRLPAQRYFPTEKNLKIWKLDKKVRRIFTNMIKSRIATRDAGAGGYGNDLLALLLEASAPEHGGVLNMEEVISECKTFFFVSHDTTSHLLTWTMFLLSTHPEWQAKLRAEVAAECGREVPTADELSKLKLVNMFLLETLRLYGPVSVLQRKTGVDLELEGGIKVARGMMLTIPVAMIHRDKEVWGEDAGEFRPERFGNGVTRAAKLLKVGAGCVREVARFVCVFQRTETS